MLAEAPGERELLARELREAPEARAARRAYERWVTCERVWDAIERDGVDGDGERARFLAARLWPDLPPPAVDNLVRHVRERGGSGEHLDRPRRAEHVVGERLAALMRAHGYPTEPPPGAQATRRAETRPGRR